MDFATVSDQDIKNDDIVYMVFQKHAGDFEEIEAETLVLQGEEMSESSTTL